MAFDSDDDKSRSEFNRMVCAIGIFNILIGGIGGCGGLFGILLLSSLGENLGALLALALLLAGALFTTSGVCLLFTSKPARHAAMGLLGGPILLGLVYFVPIIVAIIVAPGFHDWNWEMAGFVGFPGMVILLAVAEELYLWKERGQMALAVIVAAVLTVLTPVILV